MVSAESLIAEQQQFFEELRYNKDRFRDFLHTMVHHYRQPVDRQVQIFFHAPKSGSAYASAELWRRLGTDVVKDAVGVPVLGTNGTSIMYLYDISDTRDAARQELRSLVWRYDAQADQDAIHSLIGIRDGESLEKSILTACQQRAESEAIHSTDLVALGAAYVVLGRLGMDAEAVVGLPLILARYEDVNAIELLDDISRTATAVLDPIAKIVREREREDSRHDDTPRTPVTSRTTEGSEDDSLSAERGGRAPLGGSDVAGGSSVPPAGDEPAPAGVSDVGEASASDVGDGAEGNAESTPLGTDGVRVPREDVGGSGVGGGSGSAGDTREADGDEPAVPVERPIRAGGTRPVAAASEPDAASDGLQDGASLGGSGGDRGGSPGAGDPDRARESGDSIEPLTASEAPIDLSAIDYEADLSTTRGKRAVFARNLAAIQVMKQLERTGRAASEEELRLLRSYSGFGGLSDVFDPKNSRWQTEYDALRKELSQAEYDAARASILDAYYTPPEVAEAIYEGLQQFGFHGGNILEPSCGAGRFFGAMPQEIRENSHVCGIELDPLSARIAAVAYPDAAIAQQGFETTRFPDGSFDLAIGNVPFGEQIIVADEKHADEGLKIHEYFLQKMLDGVRPGGMVAAITSHYTMDKQSDKFRQALAARADLVTAIRLPASTFEGAGTSVVSDILILRKKGGRISEQEKTAIAQGESLLLMPADWRSSSPPFRIGGERNTENHHINRFFLDEHPGNVLGTHVLRSGPHGSELTVRPKEGVDLKNEILSVFQQTPLSNFWQDAEAPLPVPVQEAAPDRRPMGFYQENGWLVYVDSQGKVSSPDLPEGVSSRVLSAVRLRDAGHHVLSIQHQGCTDEELQARQYQLKAMYQEHVRKFGRIAKDRALKNAFAIDPGYNFLRAFEIKDEKENFIRMADIFTERTIQPALTPSFAETPEDALIISMQQRGCVDLPYMSELLKNRPIREIADELEASGHLYFDEERKEYVSADEYRSGNLQKKIDVLDGILDEFSRERSQQFASELFPKEAAELQRSFEERSDASHGIDDFVPANEFEEGLKATNGSTFQNSVSSYLSEHARFGRHPEQRDSIVRFLRTILTRDYMRYERYLPKELQSDLKLDFQLLRSDPEFYYHADVSSKEKTQQAILATVHLWKAIYRPEQNRAYTFRSHVSYDDWTAFRKDMETHPLEVLHLCAFMEDHLRQVGVTTFLKSETTSDLRTQYLEAWSAYESFLEDAVKERLPDASARRARAEKNRAALVEALPEPLTIDQISVPLGTPWLKPELIYAFLVDTMKVHPYDASNMQVRYAPETSQWRIEQTRHRTTAAEEAFSIPGKSAYDLVLDCLNQKNTRIEKEIGIDENGNAIKTLDVERTTQAQMKQQELQAAFRTWLLASAYRTKEVTDYYNRHFNSFRLRTYDGSKLVFPGMASSIHLKDHQKAAIAHSLYGGNTLFAHCVGAGKTFEMAASIMEAKRLGICHKALVVVPNHLTAQTGEEFQRLYPRAKILIATDRDFQKDRRKEFIARIATQNWDAIIMAESQFSRVKLSGKREGAMHRRVITRLEEAAAEADRRHPTRGKTKDFSVRAIEALKKRHETFRIRCQKESEKENDDTVPFEELGIDKLVIDEAHGFKNLELSTRHSQVAGIGTTSHVKKTWDLYMKTQYINEITGGRGLIFATGTPVSNSLTELYTMQRYLAPDRLEELGLQNFDAWAANFATIRTEMELKPEGRGYQLKERFARFNNLQELMTIFREFADVRTADMLQGDLILPEPEIIVDQAPMSRAQSEKMDEIVKRAEHIRAKHPDKMPRKDGVLVDDSFLLITQHGRDLSLDPRLLDESLHDAPDSKVNRCIRNVLSVYKETEEDRSTQVIFCDTSTSTGVHKDEFNVYDDIRQKLIASGVPEEEIAVVQEVRKQDKQALFDRVNRGEVRILLGSTDTLGVGTNIQERLIAQHDLSVPWRPSDLEQRMGRIVRPGNQNAKVKIFRYVTEGTFDAYLWQTVENKQKFISEAMSGDIMDRTTTDIDNKVLTYAEIKAVATGNPFIKEKMELENRLMRIQMARREYDAKQQKFQKLIEVTGPDALKSYDARIQSLMDDKLCLQQNTIKNEAGEETFCITINGKLITDEDEAGKMLSAIAKGGFTEAKDFHGEYKGLQLTITIDPQAMFPILHAKGKFRHDITNTTSKTGIVRSLKNLEQSLTERIHSVKQERETMAQKIADAKELIKKPFPHTEEEATKRARLIEINNLIEAPERPNIDTTEEREEAKIAYAR